jgi:hypothetical protein
MSCGCSPEKRTDELKIALPYRPHKDTPDWCDCPASGEDLYDTSGKGMWTQCSVLLGHTPAHTDAVFPVKYPTYVEIRISGTTPVFHLLSTRDLILVYSPVEKEKTGLHYHLVVLAGHEVAGTSVVPVWWWVAWEVRVVASSTGSKPVGNTLDYSNAVLA